MISVCTVGVLVPVCPAIAIFSSNLTIFIGREELRNTVDGPKLAQIDSFSDKSLNKIKIKNPTLSAVRVLVDYKEKPFFSGLVKSVEDNYYNMVKSIVRRRQRVTFIVQLLPNKRMRMTRRKKR